MPINEHVDNPLSLELERSIAPAISYEPSQCVERLFIHASLYGHNTNSQEISYYFAILSRLIGAGNLPLPKARRESGQPALD